MSFKGKYLGGHPAFEKPGSATVSGEPTGLRIKGMGRSVDVRWDLIESIKVVTENEVRGGPGAMSGLGALAGNQLLTTMYANKTRTINHTFLAVGFRDPTGFESTILFEMKQAHKASARLIADRSKFVSGSSNAVPASASSTAVTASSSTSGQPAAAQAMSPVKLLLIVLLWVAFPFIMAPLFVLKKLRDRSSAATS